MAENVTPVTLEVKDFKAREVILVDYKFNQASSIRQLIVKDRFQVSPAADASTSA